MVEVACLSSPRSTACPAALRSMRYVPERSPGVEAGALEAVGFLGLHASGLWPASRLPGGVGGPTSGGRPPSTSVGVIRAPCLCES